MTGRRKGDLHPLCLYYCWDKYCSTVQKRRPNYNLGTTSIIHFAYSVSFVIVGGFSILSLALTVDIAGADDLAFLDISALSFRSVKPGVCNFL